jgi:hypothetical protein
VEPDPESVDIPEKISVDISSLQVVRTLAGQYRDAVGPWREYLTILDHP